MAITRRNTLTPHGIARLLAQGIQASFAPQHQQAEVERLVEYLQDLAVSRANDGELPGCPLTSVAQAKRDADWLEAMADELQGMGPGPARVPGCEFCREPANRPDDATWHCPYCGIQPQ